jgi:anti-sigma regulatory factor (Ser/Thr protein kinase)
MTSVRKFPNQSTAARAARQFALANLAGYAPELLEVVELLVSELASNSVRHTESGFEVRVSSDRRRIRVSVTDSGSGRPTERALDPTAESGRGLALVKMLSSASGVTRSRSSAGGKTVWFVLDVAPHQFQPALAAQASPLSRVVARGGGRGADGAAGGGSGTGGPVMRKRSRAASRSRSGRRGGARRSL